jgi:DNA polymerase III subunit delta'
MSWDVLGHEWAAHLLQQHIERGELRHAYLFTGPPGVGRRTLALRFAQAINCLNPPAPGEPCGACRPCLQIQRIQQVDLSVVELEPERTEIRIEQMRTLQHTLSLTPVESRYRVALLLRFELANANAQNSLLKTLEEAPDKAILLLTASAAENLLPTIVSRCEVLRLRPLAVAPLGAALEENYKLTAEEARLLAHLSGGRVGYALRLHSDPDLRGQRQAWLEDLWQLLQQTKRARFAFAAQKTGMRSGRGKIDREGLRQMFLVWESFWRDLLLASSGASAPLVNFNRQAEIHSLVSQFGPDEALARLSDLQVAFQRLDDNVNPQLLLEALLLDWPRIRF